MLVGAAALGILLSLARPEPKGPTPTDGENRQSSIPAGTVQPSLEAAPDPSGPPPAATSAIRPGSVNRTSIHLSATYDAEVTLGFDDRTLGVNVAISVTNRSGGDVDRVELNTIAAPLGNLKLGPTTVDGAPIEATVRDQTIVVPLGGVLPDGATAMLRVQYRARIPTGLSGSKWMFTRTNGTLQASRWLPWVGLRHPFSRPNDGDPFFTALSPSVTVRITTDRKLVIATPVAASPSTGSPRRSRPRTFATSTSSPAHRSRCGSFGWLHGRFAPTYTAGSPRTRSSTRPPTRFGA
jgi:hypothetical protein